MRILLASHLLPPPDVTHAAGRLIFHVLHELRLRGHSVDVLAKVLPHEHANVAVLREVCSDVVTVESGGTKGALLRNAVQTALHRPFDLLRWRGRRNNLLLADHLDRLLDSRRYDLVQLELVQVLPLATVVHGRAPVLQVVHDLNGKLAYRAMEHAPGWKRLARAWYWHAALHAELRSLRACSGIATLGVFDQVMVRTLLPGIPAVQYPIALPLDGALPPPSRTRPGLLFVAALSRPVNDEAARFLVGCVWPRVQAAVADAELVIAGAGATAELERAVQAAHNVLLTGYVADLLPWYAQNHVAIAPVRFSGGILIKVLDAMALGRPVVTTTAGNEGVGAVPGRDLLVADGPQALADAAIELLRSPTLAARLAASGMHYVRSVFDWSATFDRYEQFLHSLS